jgi:spore germination cell wall hydrolase CwlJ-like protein
VPVRVTEILVIASMAVAGAAGVALAAASGAATAVVRPAASAVPTRAMADVGVLPAPGSASQAIAAQLVKVVSVDQSVALFKARVAEMAPMPMRVPTQRSWRTVRHVAPAAYAVARSARPIAPQRSAPLLLASAPVVAAAENAASLRASGDAHCLADAVYYEARNQPLAGQEAVAQVVLNRVGRAQFASDVCGVVTQGGEHRGCQFTFVCDGSLNRPPRDPAAWSMAEQIAARALSGALSSPVGDATFYHASYVKPWWSQVLPKVMQIGAHIFYGGLDHRPARAAQPTAGAPLLQALFTRQSGAPAPLLPPGSLARSAEDSDYN